MHISIPKHASDIIKTLSAHGYEAYVVGGCVRDSILGKEPADWDITTSALPEQVKALFPRTIDTGLKHGTVTIMMDKVGYEVTTYRIDGTYEDHRRPNEVTFTSDLKEDLMRRDFTINAMAYNEEHGIVPQTIKKEIRDLISVTKAALPDKEETVEIESLNKQERKDMIKKLEGQMQEAAGLLDFELAAQIRDMILEIKAMD